MSIRSKDVASLVEVRNLSVGFGPSEALVHALSDVTLSVRTGECLGIVGESGSGKSTLALALAGHIARGGRLLRGEVRVCELDLMTASPEELRRLRREKLGFVFQNPIGTLDPTRKIARQFSNSNGRALDEPRINALLSLVGLRDISRVLASYPHELSGGMAQRVAIAMAIAHEPALIIADEPTSALDASVRTQILDLLRELSNYSGASLIIVSHDLRAVKSYCDRVAVMYAGRIVEVGLCTEVFASPLHPYTEALIRAMPGQEGFGGKIRAIPGSPPSLIGEYEGCAFRERCHKAIPHCCIHAPELIVQEQWGVACHVAQLDQTTSLEYPS